MGTIIQFNPNQNTQRDIKFHSEERVNSPDNISYLTPVDSEQDTFEPLENRAAKRRSISLDEIVDLAGEEKCYEIFSGFFHDSNGPQMRSFVPDGTEPFLDTVKFIWDNSDEARKAKSKTCSEFRRTSRAFRELERAASEQYYKKTGVKTNIKIVLYDKEQDEEFYLTDALDSQANFYRKSKLAATFDFTGKKLNRFLGSVVDGMKL